MSSKQTDNSPNTSLLIILDGWGHNDESANNAIAAANTPTWDKLWAEAPHTLISGSGEDVGLPAGQMGNSEVGHMNLGAGRVVDQDLTRISKSIETGEFTENPVLVSALKTARLSDKNVHILGLLSAGGVHSHESHIQAFIEMAAHQGNQHVYVHAFLDGRDTPPRSAKESINNLERCLKQNGYQNISSVTGRYYAMDRDNRWDRVQLAYDLLTCGTSEYRFSSALKALEGAYAREENDEFVRPTTICADQASPTTIQNGDVVVFMNFRADRARQLTRAFTEDNFDNFERQSKPQLSQFVTLTSYADNIKARCAFESQKVKNSLGEHISALGFKQLRIAETEKYAHVTFFFSGGQEAAFPGESRCLIPSPNVATYDLKPEMSAAELTDRLIEAICSGEYKTIICNFANGDMVGHTGVFSAAVSAVETLDNCLARIVDVVQSEDAQCLITADHGNVERMHNDETGQAHTAHTSLPVPLVYVALTSRMQTIKLKSQGSLSDVAPTMLDLMQLNIPAEMSGHSLVVKKT